MDQLAHRAVMELQKEVNRPLSDRGGFQESQVYSKTPQRPADQEKLARFLREEQVYRDRRNRKNRRQTLAWVLIGTLLPLLAFILRYLHIQGWFGN